MLFNLRGRGKGGHHTDASHTCRFSVWGKSRKGPFGSISHEGWNEWSFRTQWLASLQSSKHIYGMLTGPRKRFHLFKQLVGSSLLETEPCGKVGSHERRACCINTEIYLVFDMACGPGISTGEAQWHRWSYSSWLSFAAEMLSAFLPWWDQGMKTALKPWGFQREGVRIRGQCQPGHLVNVPNKCQCLWLLHRGSGRMCFQMGSWHTLPLCGSEMLPEVLATAGPLPSWLQLDWVADGGTTGVVGLGRSCLGKSRFSG